MTRDLKAAYRADEPMTLDERAEAQRMIVAEYREQLAQTMPGYRQPHPLELGAVGYGAYIIGTAVAALACEPNKNMVD